MKAHWARLAERIDSATLRERVMLFGAAALVIAFVVHTLLISPLHSRQQQLGAEIAQKEKALRIVQTELQRLARARGTDPDERNRAKVAQLREELVELDARIADQQRRFTDPQRMRAVLEGMLERNPRLHLVDLRTLPVKELSIAQGQGPRGAHRVYRHGVEMTVAGRYLDIHAYLKSLEGAPSQLYWGGAEMTVSEYPVARLKVTVYTLSFNRAWLVV